MIVSVAMGGVYLGEALNHYLHLPHYFIKAKSYVGQQRGELSVAIPEGVHNCGTKLLLVDDIADSGHTLDAILKKLPSKQVQIITLFYKPRSIVKPDYYAREIANDSWINFFWEKETTKESMNVQSL
jgi:hypoxanthine phosphoribosyltransferase